MIDFQKILVLLFGSVVATFCGIVLANPASNCTSDLPNTCVCFGNISGIRNIEFPGKGAIEEFCDHDTAGPGWLVIQRRVNVEIEFWKSWQEYRDGFAYYGNIWLGLENLHLLTKSQPYELYVYLANSLNQSAYALYDNFVIGSEEEDYRLIDLGNYSGTAGNSLQLNKGMKFTTWDRDNDLFENFNCANLYGPWWHNNKCVDVTLNAIKLVSQSKEIGMRWASWNNNLTVSTVRMLIRPRISRLSNL